VSPPEQFSAPRTLYEGFKNAKLKRTWNSTSLKKETLKNRKQDFRSKVLKIEKRRIKRKEVKRQHGCCVSPFKHPAHLAPTLCVFVFYPLSFLHLPLSPVRSGETRA
jgi:hypothetical protein